MSYVPILMDDYAKRYVKDTINGNSILDKISDINDYFQGCLYALLPNIFRDIAVNKFEVSTSYYTGTAGQLVCRNESIDHLSWAICHYLSQSNNNIVLAECCGAEPDDPWIVRRKELDFFLYGSELYFYCHGPGATMDEIKHMIKLADMNEHLPVIFSKFAAASRCKRGDVLQDTDVAEILANLSLLAIEAFDGEAFLYYFRDEKQVSDLLVRTGNEEK